MEKIQIDLASVVEVEIRGRQMVASFLVGVAVTIAVIYIYRRRAASLISKNKKYNLLF